SRPSTTESSRLSLPDALPISGGLTRAPRPGSGESTDPKTPPLTFPNASIVTQGLEWRDAKANRSTMHATYLPDHLTPEVAERVRLIEGDAPQDRKSTRLNSSH